MTSPYLNIIKKMRTAKELFAELNSFDENRRIEAKSASAVGKSMMEFARGGVSSYRSF